MNFRYQSAKDPSQVDYMRFSDEIESIFTRKNLEKTPTAEVVQFVPPVGVNMYVLSPEEEQTLQKTMHRLAERVSFCVCVCAFSFWPTSVTIAAILCENCRFVFAAFRYFLCLKTTTEFTLAV